jgi:hypothetical protein
VKGPTCIFPGRQSGGDLLRPIKEEGDTKRSSVELITVPCVPGRLLRFQGDYLHAVPRPTDLWLLKFVQGSSEFTPEEDWGRSVVLFNTWGDEPPKDVPEDDAASQDFEHRNDIIPTLFNPFKTWNGVYKSSSAIPQGNKNDVECDDNDNEHVSAKIWLLGDYRRRDHQMQTVKFEADENILRQALYEESTVSCVKMFQP